jgi:hypothetical protein
MGGTHELNYDYSPSHAFLGHRWGGSGNFRPQTYLCQRSSKRRLENHRSDHSRPRDRYLFRFIPNIIPA